MQKSLSVLRLFGFGIVVAVIAGGGLWFNYQAQEEARLTSAHLSFGSTPGYPWRAGQPNFNVDLFGDGTVVFQGPSKGSSYIYHVPKKDTLAFLKAFEASAYLQETKVDGAAIDAPYCGLSYEIAGQAERGGGCYVLRNGMSSRTFHPQIMRLMTLVHVQDGLGLSKDKLPADTRPYLPSKQYPVFERFQYPACPPSGCG